MPQLTEHFTLEELVHSNTAIRLDIDNTPPQQAADNLKRLANLLEKVRTTLNAPLIISSGYRCSKLNEAVGGARDSQHLLGCAADFIAPKFGTPEMICHAIMDAGLIFDQLIHEFGAWTHISIAPLDIKLRRQVLTIDKLGTRPGILDIRAVPTMKETPA